MGPIMPGNWLEARAAGVVKKIVAGAGPNRDVSSMSTTFYDTAWVSMVFKDNNGFKEALFPECFDYLLQNQLSDGAWGQYASDVDGILNTMAGLLALRQHFQDKPEQTSRWHSQLDDRTIKAKTALCTLLETWDVTTCDHVGFEILVPALLRLLEKDASRFEFPGRKALMDLNQNKMAKFSPEILYRGHPTTMIHCLEAFSGMVDFDRLHHYKTFNSMMASPSATAAYLIHSSTWDYGAEQYLRNAMLYGCGRGSGGVPSAFPSPIFELTWSFSTLLESGFLTQDLGTQTSSFVADFLESELSRYGGVIGFAPGLLGDADDTAKCLLTLQLLGRSFDPEPMIKMFEATTHFLTYPGERNASFSANCNILLSLLNTYNPNKYSASIQKATEYLCGIWDRGAIHDKWNLSVEYSMMLLTQAFTHLLRLWDHDDLKNVPGSPLVDRIPLILTQIALRTLEAQETNGSWMNGSCEASAYAILTLRRVQNLPWLDIVAADIGRSIDHGLNFLSKSEAKWAEGSYLWVEKVTYRSSTLSQVYCLAAMKPHDPNRWTSRIRNMVVLPIQQVAKYASFFAGLPLFTQMSQCKIKLTLVEAFMFLPRLRRIRLDVFPRTNMAKDEYLAYIPFTWLGINNLHKFILSNATLWEMMILSMLNYQVDEFMETAMSIPDDAAAHDLIDKLCRDPEPEQTDDELGGRRRTDPSDGDSGVFDITASDEKSGTQDGSMADQEVLTKYIKHIINHSAVLTSHASVQKRLKDNMRLFLHAHISQNTSNKALQHAQAPTQSFFTWVRGISAHHTSCPISFEFFSALTTPSSLTGSDPFPSATARYLSADVVQHLSTLCRQYNDVGSITRDRAESNLNSVDFDEFKTDDTSPASKELLEIADYERQCLDLAWTRLEKVVSREVMSSLKVFVDVTDLYGQIYVARDIASRVRMGSDGE